MLEIEMSLNVKNTYLFYEIIPFRNNSMVTRCVSNPILQYEMNPLKQSLI